jgi:hypothetical protein
MNVIESALLPGVNLVMYSAPAPEVGEDKPPACAYVEIWEVTALEVAKAPSLATPLTGLLEVLS